MVALFHRHSDPTDRNRDVELLLEAEGVLAPALRRRHATRRALAQAEATLEYHRAHFRIQFAADHAGTKPTLQQIADELTLLEAHLREGFPELDDPHSAALTQYDRCQLDADQAQAEYEVALLRYDTARRILRDGGQP